MKNIFLFYASIVFIAFTPCAFTSCETIKDEEMPYNATIVNAGFTVRVDFLDENEIYHPFKDDKTLPEDRAFIIPDKDKLDDIFSVFPSINFEKEMIVMYMYTSSYVRKRSITSVTFNNNKLLIKFKYAELKPGIGDATTPARRLLVIKMDKLDIDAVEFKLLNP
jgi:hypothetical protein